MTKLYHCILTGFQFDKPIELNITNEPVITYENVVVGKVKIAHPTLISLTNQKKYKNPILAGICRNAFENKTEPPIITQSFIDNELKNIKFPQSFKEKCLNLLKYIYNNGGNDFKTFDFLNVKDYPICFADDAEQFSKIIEYLEEKYMIKWHSIQAMAGLRKRYLEVRLTDYGIEEVEKDLPKIPLIGLVDQEISTGNADIDIKINHAKKMFFQEPQTMDRMRSSCETLSFILEPIRQEIKKYLPAKDVEDFFNIVNNFDIRHNKEKTKEIKYPEQLEWIFYSLLNSINTYTKLKDKFEK
jgi:hypothetical protein